jgi:hypothetical protein
MNLHTREQRVASLIAHDADWGIKSLNYAERIE